MAGQVYTARQTAREVTKRLGRDVDAKRVRAWVRDNVAAFDDDGYTAHVYSHGQYTAIVAGMVARGRAARPTAAHTGRKAPKAPKVVAKAPKAPSVAPSARTMGSGPVVTTAPAAPAVTVKPA